MGMNRVSLLLSFSYLTKCSILFTTPCWWNRWLLAVYTRYASLQGERHGYVGQAGPHQIDWYWQPLSSARIPHNVHVIFDRAGVAPAVRPKPLERAEAVTA